MRAIIRAASPSDFSAIQALVFGSHIRALAPIDVSARCPLIFPSLATAEAFSNSFTHFWVAAADDAVIGAISIITNDDARPAELNAFYVADAHQRRGIGARLMAEALGFCRAAGVRKVELTSNKGHYDNAIVYYLRLGFTHVKEYPVGYGIVLVDLELELT